MSTTRETAEQLTTTDEALDLLAAEYERATRDLEELKQAARDALRLTDVVYPPHERLIALLDRLDK